MQRGMKITYLVGKTKNKGKNAHTSTTIAYKQQQQSTVWTRASFPGRSQPEEHGNEAD